MQPLPNKLSVIKRTNGLKKREGLIPCSKKLDDSISNNKTRKKSFLNLFILGKIWMDLLSKALVGEKVDVTAAQPRTGESLVKKNEIKPQLPKIQYQTSIIKYKDLPVYQDQNIIEYDKDTQHRKKYFAENIMRLHSYLVPHVSYCRTTLQKSFYDVKNYVLNEFERRKDVVRQTKEKIRANMSDPDKLPYRYTAAATGGLTGYLLSASGGISRRVIFTSLGLLSTGVVCFPKESDKIFKNVVYGAAKFCVYLYNTVTDEELQLRRDKAIEMRDDIQPPNTNTHTQIVKCPTIK